MIGGINLHAMVRGPICGVHPDVTATLYRSEGRIIGEDGGAKAIYAPGISVTAQMQSESPAALYHAGVIDQTEDSRKFYLFSSPDPGKKVTGEYRPLSRGGDMFQLDDTTWWLVTALVEDFSRAGWVSVRATLQVIPPDFSGSGWWLP